MVAIAERPKVKRRVRKAPKALRGKSPAQIEAYLDTPEAIERFGASGKDAHLRALRRVRKVLDRETPTSTWADAAYNLGEKLPTGWVRCVCCGRDTPPQTVGSRGDCYDCHIGAMSEEEWSHLPSSPSGLAIRVAAVLGVKVDRYG